MIMLTQVNLLFLSAFAHHVSKQQITAEGHLLMVTITKPAKIIACVNCDGLLHPPLLRGGSALEMFSPYFFRIWREFCSTLRHMAVSHGSVTYGYRRPSHHWEALSCSYLANLSEVNLTGRCEHDRLKGSPITFQVLPPVFQTPSVSALPHGYMGQIQRKGNVRY